MKNYTQKFIGILALVFAMYFSVNAQQGYDVTPPVITSIMASPDVVDVSESLQFVTITATGTDDLSGIQYLDGYFSAPTNGGLWMSLYPETLANGDVVYVGEIEVPHASSYSTAIEPGIYTFNYANAYDNAGNSSGWYSDSFQTTFEVTYITFVLGCTDISASNYNSEANTEDNSCISWEEHAASLQEQLDAVIPEDGIGQAEVDAAYAEGAASVTPEDGIGQADVDAAYVEGAASVTPEDGVSQADVDAAFADGVASVEAPECEEVATQNMPLDLPEGWSMFGYTCMESLNAVDAFSDISYNIEIVKDEWGLAYLPSYGFSAFDNLEFSEGYQIKMIEEVTNFQFCDAIIPQDGIGQADVDAAYDNGVASVDITSDNADVYAEGAASVTPEDGITQADVDAAVDAITPEDGISQSNVDAVQALLDAIIPEDGVTQADLDALAESYAGYTAPIDLQIGDLHAGGIVFQINENGSGLVAAMEDLPDYYNWDQANSQASSYSSEGYTGWHLPSRDELQLMYNTIGQGADNSGNFEYTWYWSSSEYHNYDYAWYVSFHSDSGNAYTNGKHNTYRVRVIRSF